MPIVKLNGEETPVPDDFSIEDLLKRRGIKPESVIAARNSTVVNSSYLATTKLEDGDEIEIMRFVAGG
jgi:thiamine biosynthesis protein ThiS